MGMSFTKRRDFCYLLVFYEKDFNIFFLIFSLFSCTDNEIIFNKYKNINISKESYKTLNNSNKQNYFIIVPHHSITAKNIDKFYNKISKEYINIENIVIISPNHYWEWNDFLESFKQDWNYCFWKESEISTKGFNFLNCINWWKLDFYNYKKSDLFDLVNYERNTLFEHWIGEHFKYINKYFSNYKKVFPVVLKIENDEKYEKTKKVFEKLKNYDFWNWNTLFIASVDFSHHVFEKIAVFHDLNSVVELNKKDFKKAEVDCPNCLFLVKKLAKENKKEIFKLENRTSSSDIIKKRLLYENTTHIFWEFILGDEKQKEKYKKQNIDFFDKLGKYKILITQSWIPYLTKEKENQNFISWMFFWDSHLTRSFLYKNENKEYNIPKSYDDKKKYFDCFYQNKDINKNPEYWKNRIFYSFDFVWINFETASCEKKYTIKSEKIVKLLTVPNNIEYFKNIWINLYNLANNHSYDYWNICFEKTKQNLKNNWLYYFWEWRKKESNILKLKRNWLKIVFIWVNTTTYSWSLKDKINKIKKLKKEWYKIILNIHWGLEFKIKNNYFQQKLAHKFIDAWVDMIIGHHPHIIQNIEIYKSKPIFYSLWNFIFDQVFDKTIKWMWVVYLLWENSLRYNEIYFDRDKKDFSIDCNSWR